MSSTASVNLTPTITSLGVGSGLDLNSIVTSLVAVEQQPITQLQAAASVLQTHISDFGQISSLLSTLQSAATSLRNPGLWNGQTVASSNASAVSATVTTGALSGNYAVSVNSLASAQTVVTNNFYSSATALVGSGTLNLQLGSWDPTQTTFTPGSGSPTPITVTSTDTLQSLASKINAAGMGVTASLVTDSNGVRLALTSIKTGAANGFQVSEPPSDGGTLQALTTPSNSDANGGMHFATPASDTSATINGIAVSSASNVISGAISGMTLTLGQLTTSPVNIAVSPDTGSISTAIQSFVTAFNGVASYLQTATAYDASTSTAGDLQGDPAANALQQQLRATLSQTTGASSVFKSLSDVGLQFQQDGTLSLDQPTLTAALNNLPQLQKAFTSINTTDPTKNGFATNFFNLTSQVLGPNGLVTTATSSLQAQLGQNSDQQTALNNQVAAYQQTLVAQYSALDAQLGQLSALNSYVTQQLAAMTSSSNSSG